MADHCLDAVAELADRDLFELASGHVLYLVEQHLSGVQLRGAGREGQGQHLLFPQHCRSRGVQVPGRVVDQVGLDRQVGRPRVEGHAAVGACGGRRTEGVEPGQPSLECVVVVLCSVEAVVDLVELDAVVGGDDGDVQHVLLVDDVVQFAVLSVLHPHAAPALVQRHVHHSEVEQRLGPQRHLPQQAHETCTESTQTLVAALWFLEGELFVVVLQVFEAADERFLGQVEAQL